MSCEYRVSPRGEISETNKRRRRAALKGALASCRLFVEHPIARMTGLCALIRRATTE